MAAVIVNSNDFAKQLILSELKTRQKSIQDSISRCQQIIADPVNETDFGDYYERSGAAYELERNLQLKRFVDEMIFTMESKRECNTDGYFLDCTCTCPTDRSYIRTTACNPCRDRISESLDNVRPVTRSQFKHRSACGCEYCFSRSGEYWDMLMYYGLFEYYSMDCKCYKTKSLDSMCTTCLLKFTADQMHNGRL
jgi:hypothetical protein